MFFWLLLFDSCCFCCCDSSLGHAVDAAHAVVAIAASGDVDTIITIVFW